MKPSAKHLTPLLVHVAGAVAATAIGVTWGMRLFTAPPPVPPAVAAASIPREADPALAARAFGDTGVTSAAAQLNVQVGGVFVAGRDSSAVLTLDGRPPRAVVVGREVAAGTRLVEVRPDGVTLERDGARSTYPAPAAAIARSSAATPLFRREGDTLTAPMQDAAPAGRAAAGARPEAGVAQMPAGPGRQRSDEPSPGGRGPAGIPFPPPAQPGAPAG